MRLRLIPITAVCCTLFISFWGCDRPKQAGPAPIADFDFSSDNDLFAPTKITFNDRSTNALELKWDFSDGSSSTEKNPTKQFARAGNYSVTLNVKDEYNRRDSKTRFIPINAAPAPNIITILISATNTGTAPSVVTFNPTIDNANRYVWSFGDPGSPKNSSTELNPTHEYKFPGEYAVTLTATGVGGTSSKEVRVTIR